MRVPVRLVAALLPLAALIAPCSAQAVAHPVAADHTAGVRGGSPDSAAHRVADFYGAYVDAVSDGTDSLGHELRSHYLTRDFQHRLTVWEEANHADGVLRAQDVPTHWQVSYHDSGAGHLFTTVTLTWGTGPHATHTRLAVQSDLSTKLISDIQEEA
ncbi:hypothetical protein [Streptacidiphilus sp. MAP5-3]|uniref:hypothetical protein n=1 Tax=unclassified Streptacidiphilus TaxID=2643834 RepID=UPI0035114859